MSRTKLLFVFARHSGAWYDRRFHRKHIAQFLASTGDAPAVVIKEVLDYHNVRSAPVTDEEKLELLACRGKKDRKKRAALQNELSEIEKHVNSFYAATLGRGVFPGGRDIGYDRLVAEVNKAAPGRVGVLVEPQNVTSAYNSWKEELAGNKVDDAEWNLELLTEALEVYIPALIQFQVARDKDVHALAEKLRAENRDRSIIIPRGTAHFGMPQLFSHEAYEATIVKMSYAPDFTDELLEQSYLFPPSSDAVSRCARLEAHYIQYFQPRASNVVARLLGLLGLKDYVERRIMVEAKAYAREQVPDAFFIHNVEKK